MNDIPKFLQNAIFGLSLFPILSYASLPNLSVNAALGALSGESLEYVYGFGKQKLSQLNWKIGYSPILKAQINYEMFPWLSLNGQGWITLAKGRSTMDDYDWMNPFQSRWTDWSHHKNTQLTTANASDLNVRGWLLRRPNYKIGASLGYERNAFTFLSKGGCFQYLSGELEGCFPTELPVIRYQQTFRTVYAGLLGEYTLEKFSLGLVLKFSPLVQAQDIDKHYLRNLTFKDTGENSRYYSATLSVGYYLTTQTKLFAEASYDRYSLGRGDTNIISHDWGTSQLLPDSAGLSNKNYSLALGFHYQF